MPLFPEIAPFKTGRLPLTDGHTMHYELSGNPKGTPVVVLHGGPGTGLSARHHRLANPKTCLTIAYDQRGCGKSKPFGELKANTTAHLVADLERLRAHLQIKQWVVVGFSWGCTLALAYAQAHPKAVKGLVVGGVFLGTRRECAWLTHPDGVARFYPQEYAMMREALGNPKPADIGKALIARLKGNDKKARERAAIAWCRLEGVACEVVPDRAVIEKDLRDDPAHTASLCLLEAHYFRNDCFLKPNQLLNGIHRIAHIPLAIVQGENDMVCPSESAYALHAAHPASTLTVVRACGHRATPKGQTARVNALKKLLKSLNPDA